jgi:hypothetical protein
LARLAVNFNLGDVGAVGEGKVRRVVEGRLLQASFQSCWQVVGRVGGSGNFGKGLGPVGRTLDMNLAGGLIVDHILLGGF